MQPSDLADRYTILKIKKENGLKVEKELQAYQGEVKDIDPNLLEKLYTVNKAMWVMEDIISEIKDRLEIGVKYMWLRRMTLVRNKVKNEITKKHGGFKELKKY